MSDGDTTPGTGQGTAPADWLRQNLDNWNDRVRVHEASDFYDLAGFRAGRSTLREFEVAEVGDVTGKRLLHLMCHMGQDTLSWARLGAEVTGLDFSAPAVRAARALAEDIGVSDRARFVVSDVYEAAAALPGERFDIVCTGLGALVWLPDLPRWARVVASLLDVGGVFHLAEFHPFADMLAEDGSSVRYDYFDAAAQTWDNPYTYTDGPALDKPVSVQWSHPLGEVVTAVAAAGLRIEFLHEHDVTYFERFPVLKNTPTGYRFPPGHPRLPLLYSIRATKPAD